MAASPGGSTSPSSPAPLIQFGTFELDLESRNLRKQGRRVRLADQPFQVLRALLLHAGHMVTREQLRRELWSDDTFVDFDVGLNSAVRKLRDALTDSADNPTFIETIPRRGYRFIAPVSSKGPVTWTGGGLLAFPPVPVVAAPSTDSPVKGVRVGSPDALQRKAWWDGIGLALT